MKQPTLSGLKGYVDINESLLKHLLFMHFPYLKERCTNKERTDEEDGERFEYIYKEYDNQKSLSIRKYVTRSRNKWYTIKDYDERLPQSITIYDNMGIEFTGSFKTGENWNTVYYETKKYTPLNVLDYYRELKKQGYYIL